MVSGNSIRPSIGNSRIGSVSGQDKFDALSQEGNTAGGSSTKGSKKISAGGIANAKNLEDTESQDTGETAENTDGGDKSKTSLSGDSVRDRVVKDATNKSIYDRLKDAEEAAKNFQPQNQAADPSQFAQNQGMDPNMLAALAGKGQQGSGSSGSGGAKPSSSQPSSSQAVKEQMQKLNDKLNDVTKSSREQIAKLMAQQTESRADSIQARLGEYDRASASDRGEIKEKIAGALDRASYAALPESSQERLRDIFGDELSSRINTKSDPNGATDRSAYIASEYDRDSGFEIAGIASGDHTSSKEFEYDVESATRSAIEDIDEIQQDQDIDPVEPVEEEIEINFDFDDIEE